MSDHPENDLTRRDDDRRRTGQENQLPLIQSDEPHPVTVEHQSDEVSDSLLDSQQEVVIDRKTQELLDSLDDELEGEAKAVSAGTAVLLDTLDKIKPQTITSDNLPSVSDARDSSEEINRPKADANPRESLDGVPDLLQEGEATHPPITAPSQPVEEAVEAPPIYRYRVAAVLSSDLEAMINAALKAVDLGLPDSGLFQWQAPFRTDQPHALASALDQWVTRFLPIKTGLERVHSEVVGTQTYIVGWRLENNDALHTAQTALTTQLAPIIEPEPDAPATFRAVIPVKSTIPPDRLPPLVGFLQRNFEEQSWTIEAVELLRAPVPNEEEIEERESEETPIDEWEVIATFKPGV
ncbi:MAG: hypothetical protein HY862_08410 [Chloroflexi bacterium]|nr:hypothetical protein [Chloroflexota bacterium]